MSISQPFKDNRRRSPENIDHAELTSEHMSDDENVNAPQHELHHHLKNNSESEDVAQEDEGHPLHLDLMSPKQSNSLNHNQSISRFCKVHLETESGSSSLPNISEEQGIPTPPNFRKKINNQRLHSAIPKLNTSTNSYHQTQSEWYSNLTCTNREEPHITYENIIPTTDISSRVKSMIAPVCTPKGYIPPYTVARFTVYFVSCILYVIADIFDEFDHAASYIHQTRPFVLVIFQFIFAFFVLIDTIFHLIAGAWHTYPLHMNPMGWINFLCFVPLLLAIVTSDRQIYSPTFLHCWGARSAIRLLVRAHLEGQIRRFQRSETASFAPYDIVSLVGTLICILFTASAGIEHLSRIESEEHMNLFDAAWFCMVTFATVGFGDIVPENSVGRAWVMGMIVLIFVMLPRELGRLAEVRRRMHITGGTYSGKSRTGHVVFCGGHVHTDTVRDFLYEFFARDKEQQPYVIVMVSVEPSRELHDLLKLPQWRNKTKLIRGSAMQKEDLIRARIHQAKAVFLVSERRDMSATEADARTILRSWAINDFKPSVRQYVQILLSENVAHIEKVNSAIICGEELRLALLSYSCAILGISTLITQLIHSTTHTARHTNLRYRYRDIEEIEDELQHILSKDDIPPDFRIKCQHKLRELQLRKSETVFMYFYASCSSNEIFSCVLRDSKHLNQFIHLPFNEACYKALRFDLVLIGVVVGSEDPSTETVSREYFVGSMVLNPGKKFVLEPYDTVYYIAKMSEEFMRQSKHRREDPIDHDMHEDLLSLSADVYANEKWHYVVSANTAAQRLQATYGPETTDADDEDNSDQTETFSGVQKRIKKRASPILSRSISTMALDTETNAGLIKHNPVSRSTNSILLLQAQPPLNLRNRGNIHQNRPCNQMSVDSDIIIQYISADLMYLGSVEIPCHMLVHPRQWRRETSNSLNLASFSVDDIEEFDDYIIIDMTSNQFAEDASGTYLFLAHLRAARFVRLECFEIKPVVLLTQRTPSKQFLDFIAMFPLIFFYSVGLSNLQDSRLRVCLERAYIVLLLKPAEHRGMRRDMHTVDATSILDVAQVTKRFPDVKIMVELVYRNSMRFVQYEPLHLTKQGIYTESPFAFLYRSAYASGNVFSASMLDTLLYQAYNKGKCDVIQAVKQLLGVHVFSGSHLYGHRNRYHKKAKHNLSAHLHKEYAQSKYGVLAQIVVTTKLLASVGDVPIYDAMAKYLLQKKNCVPIGILSTWLDIPSLPLREAGHSSLYGTHTDLRRLLLLTRLKKEHTDKELMAALDDLTPENNPFDAEFENMTDRDDISSVRGSEHTANSYVLTNPPLNTPIKVGDIIYVITRPAQCAVAKPVEAKLSSHKKLCATIPEADFREQSTTSFWGGDSTYPTRNRERGVNLHEYDRGAEGFINMSGENEEIEKARISGGRLMMGLNKFTSPEHTVTII